MTICKAGKTLLIDGLVESFKLHQQDLDQTSSISQAVTSFTQYFISTGWLCAESDTITLFSYSLLKV